jgi:surface antigen
VQTARILSSGGSLLLSTQVNWKTGGRLLSLALLGGITLGPSNAALSGARVASTAPAHTWLSLEGSWLCRTWSAADPLTLEIARAGETRQQDAAQSTTTAAATGDAVTVHCTKKWHVDSEGHLISEMPAWVPNPAGEWPAASGTRRQRLPHTFTISHPAPRKAAPRLVHHVAARAAPAPAPTVAQAVSSPHGISSWTPVPGHPSYALGDFAGDPYASLFGVCTWYAWYRKQSEPLLRLGTAASWAYSAASFGLRTGTTPVVGATAVFQPGVEGAGSGGHVAHVEQVLGGGWFIVSEMNFYWNGGGWGRVDWRYVYVAPGVTFIY